MRKIIAVGGYGFGDEGKATIVEYLALKHGMLIVARYNGGSQAAHHIVTPDGINHCFTQFGSGNFLPGTKTFLTRHMLIDPLMVIGESEVLASKGVKTPTQRLIIDKECLVITPFHKIINRMQEVARGRKRHGSCGRGVGQAVSTAEQLREAALRVGDLITPDIMYKKLRLLRVMKIDLAEQISNENKGNEKLAELLEEIKNPDYINWLIGEYFYFIRNSGANFYDDDSSRSLIREGGIIFEGAQGVLLDPKYGFWPHITKTRTTFKNALELIKESGYEGEVVKVGVLRAYSTRHGAGPFVTEDARLAKAVPEIHNTKNVWQGSFRAGWFDLVAAKYAIEAAGKPDYFAMTNLDRLADLGKIKVCSAYEYKGEEKDLLEDYFECGAMPGEKIIIKKIKKTGKEKNETLTRLLFDCEPFEFMEFDGWGNTTGLSEADFLPEKIKKYIDFLSSPEGLDTPIRILSFGPTYKDKIEL